MMNGPTPTSGLLVGALSGTSMPVQELPFHWISAWPDSVACPTRRRWHGCIEIRRLAGQEDQRGGGGAPNVTLPLIVPILGEFAPLLFCSSFWMVTAFTSRPALLS